MSINLTPVIYVLLGALKIAAAIAFIYSAGYVGEKYNFNPLYSAEARACGGSPDKWVTRIVGGGFITLILAVVITACYAVGRGCES